MKILMTADHFNLPGDEHPIGGMQRVVSGLTGALRRLSHEVRWSYKFGHDAELLEAIEWCDWVISNDWGAYLHEIEKPQVIVFHGWEGKFPPDPEIVRFRQEIASKANAVVHVGSFLRKYYGTIPDLIIWGGIDMPEEGCFRTEEGKCLWVGRLEEDTCAHLALETCERMGWSLDVCGDGRLRESLQERFPWARFHGFVEEPFGVLPEAEYVFCTGYISLLEAMAREKIPLVFWANDLRAGRVMGIPGRILGSDSVDGLLRQLNWLSLAKRTRMVEDNYRFAADQTWIRVAAQFEELMRRRA